MYPSRDLWQGNRIKTEEVRAKSAKHAKVLLAQHIGEEHLTNRLQQPWPGFLVQIKGRLNNYFGKMIFLILAVLVTLARAILSGYFNAFALRPLELQRRGSVVASRIWQLSHTDTLPAPPECEEAT